MSLHALGDHTACFQRRSHLLVPGLGLQHIFLRGTVQPQPKAESGGLREGVWSWHCPERVALEDAPFHTCPGGSSAESRDSAPARGTPEQKGWGELGVEGPPPQTPLARGDSSPSLGQGEACLVQGTGGFTPVPPPLRYLPHVVQTRG